jgi:hypothetical protein
LGKEKKQEKRKTGKKLYKEMETENKEEEKEEQEKEEEDEEEWLLEMKSLREEDILEEEMTIEEGRAAELEADQEVPLEEAVHKEEEEEEEDRMGDPEDEYNSGLARTLLPADPEMERLEERRKERVLERLETILLEASRELDVVEEEARELAALEALEANELEEDEERGLLGMGKFNVFFNLSSGVFGSGSRPSVECQSGSGSK